MSGTALDLTGYHLSFDDEFNSFPSSADGKTGWDTTIWGLRVIGSESEYYSDSTTGYGNPFTLTNGELTITATPKSGLPSGRTYTSGIIDTSGGSTTTSAGYGQTYGYFEVRAQLPAGQGMWPQFWLYPKGGYGARELDVLEAFGAKNQATGEGGPNTYHWAVHDDRNPEVGGWVPASADETGGYHTYGLKWTPSTLQFYFDGALTAQTPTPSDMNVPMFLITGLAVGGSWAGAPAGETSQMKVDYVRAYSSDSAVAATPLQTVSGPDGGGNSFYGADVGQTPPPPPPPPTFTPSPDNTVIMAPSANAITDNSGNLWTITAGGQVATNGTPDAVTSGVTELAWEKGVIWQENTWGDWYSETSPGAGWQGPTKTSPVPSATLSPDTIAVVLSGEAAKGASPQFIVKMDGQQIGSGTVTASHSASQTQEFDFTKAFAAGTHQLEIDFANDTGGGGKQRGLWVENVRYDGSVVMGTETAMHGHPVLSIPISDGTN